MGHFGGKKAFVHHYVLKVEEKLRENEDREKGREA